jgi:2-deoxystreptamine N-acetyl-D-glucosaminyltransferase/2-deoxystreptamine glucosyltransferase
MTRILRLTPHFYHDRPKRGWDKNFDPIGGMQIQIRNLVERISMSGVIQDVVTSKIPGVCSKYNINRRTQIISTGLSRKIVGTKKTAVFGLTLFWAFGALKWSLDKANRYDAIHVHASGLVSVLIVGWVISKILNIPYFITIHCSRSVTHKEHGVLGWLLNFLFGFFEREIIRRSAKTIVLTHRLLKHLRGYGKCYSDNVIVIPDGIDSYQFRSYISESEKQILISNYGIRSDLSVVAFVGRIDFEKGWEVLLEATNYLTCNLNIVFCGDGAQSEKLKYLISKSKKRHNYIVTGFVDRKEVANIIDISDVLCIPSHHEEFGSVSLEGLALKKKIVASNIGGLKLVLKDIGIFFKAGDSKDLSNKLMQALNMNLMGKNYVEVHNYENRLHKYSVEDNANQYISLYKNTIGHVEKCDEFC